MVNLSKLVMGDCCVVALHPRTLHVIVKAKVKQRDPRVNVDDLGYHARSGVHGDHHCTTPRTLRHHISGRNNNGSIFIYNVVFPLKSALVTILYGCTVFSTHKECLKIK